MPPGYRLAVRVGAYRLTAQLSGFQTVTRTSLQLLLGQQAALNLELAPATLQETVTVTAEAPLLDTAASTVGANIDPRQMQDLPINGRNWMDLALLTPGARRNESGGFVQNRQGYSQTNVDGQQVTTIYHSTPDNEQPQWSRDSIAEFEVVANRFDATQGRSSGMVVNAITKTGTNSFSGTVAGYFRNDSFNASDFVAKRVLPYSNQQTSGSVGGPIIRDRLHFFAGYEYEREPRRSVRTRTSVSVDLRSPTRAQALGGGFRITEQARFWARVSGPLLVPRGRGAITHPVHGAAGRSEPVQRRLHAGLSNSFGERDQGAHLLRTSRQCRRSLKRMRLHLHRAERCPVVVLLLFTRRESAEHHPEHRQHTRRLHHLLRLARPS